MKRTTLFKWIGIAAIALLAAAGAPPSARAHGDEILVSGQAGVRVWVDGGDIYDDYDDVSVYLRADRDCYATLMLVDTDGYLHVLYPSSPYDRAWLHGGRTYRYDAYELGLDRLDGVGIAHLYAVGSPAPFDYSYYGASVFIGGFGFRVYGDPYIACRDFYVSLLPVSCRWDYVGVSSARFYVSQWVRYPSYLCTPGFGVHVRIGDSCRECSHVYTSYRYNVASPYEVLRPEPRKFKREYASDRAVAPFGRVEQARAKAVGDDSRRGREANDEFVRSTGKSAHKSVARPVQSRAKRVESAKVVSTSRSGQSARTNVKATDRKARISTSAKRGSDDARVVRKSSVTTAKQSVATKRSASTAKQSVATKRSASTAKQSVATKRSASTAKQSVATKRSASTTKQSVANKKSGKASPKKGAKRVRQAQ